MSFEEFFRDFWWLMFPVFGMFMAVWGMSQSERQTKSVIDLIKSYTDQGKDPPPELLSLASRSLDLEQPSPPQTGQHSGVWSFFVFAALSWGFGVGWYMVRSESWAFALMMGAVVTGIMAVGALWLLIFGRK